jgi:outer membrane receptor protein involved in Fe transport
MTLQRFRTLFVLWACVLIVQRLVAQDDKKKEPTQREIAVPESLDVSSTHAEAPLPKIELPEFLITGNETIDLPSSSKSATEGEKLYVEPPASAGHRPASAASGISNMQLNDLSSPAPPMNGRVAASIGNYATPKIQGWFGKNYDDGGILFDAHYNSSAGYVSNSDIQNGGINIAGNYLTPPSLGIVAGSRLSGGLGFSGESWRAYGSSDPTLVRTLDNAQVNLGLSSRLSNTSIVEDPVDYSAGVLWKGLSLRDSTTGSENDYGAFASASTQIEQFRLSGSTEYIFSDLSMPLPQPLSTHGPQWFSLQLRGSTWIAPSFQTALTVQQYLYSGNISPLQGRFFPNLELRYLLNNDATLFSAIGMEMERNTLQNFIAENKYIVNYEVLEPSEIPLNFSLGSLLTLSDKVSGKVAVTYTATKNFPTFLYLDGAKVWEVMYLPHVTSTKIEIEGDYRISDENSASASVVVNSTKERDSSLTLPYIPLLTIGGVYRHEFSNGIAVEGSAQYISRRYTDFAHATSNAGYILFGGSGQYDVAENLRAEINIDNILNQQYYIWNGYRERPIFISCGLTYTW